MVNGTRRSAEQRQLPPSRRGPLSEVIDLVKYVVDDPGRARRLVLLIVVLAVVASTTPSIGDVLALLALAP